MDEKKSKNLLKASIAVLALCLLALGLYTVQSYQESKAYMGVLEQEKIDLKNELQDLLSKYEQAEKNNELLQSDLLKAQEKIRRLLDSVKKKEATYVFMRKYKRQVTSLKKEKETLFRTIDSLATVNQSLHDMVINTKTQLVQSAKRTDSLAIQNEKLIAKVSEASELKVIQLDTKGVSIKSNNSTKAEDRANNVDKIEVCFTLAENKLAPAGEKRLFVQIINPKNDLLGEQATITFGEAVLNYSKIVEVLYQNERLEICALVPAKEANLIEGRYLVNIFLGSKLLSSGEFTLD